MQPHRKMGNSRLDGRFVKDGDLPRPSSDHSGSCGFEQKEGVITAARSYLQLHSSVSARLKCSRVTE